MPIQRAGRTWLRAGDLPIGETEKRFRIKLPDGRTKTWSKDKWQLNQVRLWRDGYIFARNA